MNSIKGGHFVWIYGVFKQHPAPRLETECQTGAPSNIGYRDLDLLDPQHTQRTVEVADQQKRIPTGEWRKVIVFVMPV